MGNLNPASIELHSVSGYSSSISQPTFYYRTSFEDADSILDQGFSGETVTLYSLDPLRHDANQGEALLQVEIDMSREDLDYYMIIKGLDEPAHWDLPAKLLNAYARVSFVQEYEFAEPKN